MKHYLVDLHTHSTASDGKLSPTRLVKLAASKGMHALALTDHDTVSGLDEALAAGEQYGVKVVTGVEFSTRHEKQKQFIGIHILGYFINHHHPQLEAIIHKVQAARLEQKINQIKKLQDYGFDIPVEAVLERVSGVPGRPHIATVLMERNPERFATKQQVFDEFLGAEKKAHVGRSFALTVAESVALILEVGGLPVLAHPGVYGEAINVEQLVKFAVEAGIKGLEVYYPYRQYGLKSLSWFESLAQKYNLLMTGGTDYHAREENPIQLGDMGLSITSFQKICVAHAKMTAN